jgi:hypothetical protein
MLASTHPDLSRTLVATAGDRLALELVHWSGHSSDFGSYEVENLSLVEVDAEGLVEAIVAFDPHDRRAAEAEMRARFEAQRPAAAQAPTPRPARIEPNNATRAMRRFQVCVDARDWHALTEMHAPEFSYDDRRPLVRDGGSREKLVASVRLSIGAGARESHSVVATAGKNLALLHQRFEVAQKDVGVSELEMLLLVEMGADGRFVSSVTFAVADRAAADAEMRARFEAQGSR